MWIVQLPSPASAERGMSEERCTQSISDSRGWDESAPGAEYKEAEAYHLHSLREEKLNPSLEIRIAQIWAASKSVLCYYRDGYYRALPRNVRLIFLDTSLKNKYH